MGAVQARARGPPPNFDAMIYRGMGNEHATSTCSNFYPSTVPQDSTESSAQVVNSGKFRIHVYTSTCTSWLGHAKFQVRKYRTYLVSSTVLDLVRGYGLGRSERNSRRGRGSISRAAGASQRQRARTQWSVPVTVQYRPVGADTPGLSRAEAKGRGPTSQPFAKVKRRSCLASQTSKRRDSESDGGAVRGHSPG